MTRKVTASWRIEQTVELPDRWTIEWQVLYHRVRSNPAQTAWASALPFYAQLAHMHIEGDAEQKEYVEDLVSEIETEMVGLLSGFINTPKEQNVHDFDFVFEQETE